MKTKYLVLMIASCLTLGGCGAIQTSLNGEPEISQNVWLLSQNVPATSDQTNPANPLSANYLPPACIPTPAPPPSAADPYAAWQGNTKLINNCVSAMRQLIDVRFAKYEDSLQATNSQLNLVGDAAVIGMGGVGSLAAKSTAQILSAASGAVTGLEGKYDSDVLYSHSINIILQQMKTDRAAQGMVIDAKVSSTANGYQNMYDAANDLYKYARAGSWTEALISLEASTGSQAKACTDQQNAQQIATAENTNPANTTSTSGQCGAVGTATK